MGTTLLFLMKERSVENLFEHDLSVLGKLIAFT